MPSQYRGAIPNLDEMPKAMKELVEEMREHPAGDFALRIYSEHRSQHPTQVP